MRTMRHSKAVDTLICAVLTGEVACKEKARRVATRYRDCPYVRIMVTEGKHLYAVLFLPERQRWWIEHVAENPQGTFGLSKAKVAIADWVQYPERLSIRSVKDAGDLSPCRSSCKPCPSYRRCLGCPATVFYKGGQN